VASNRSRLVSCLLETRLQLNGAELTSSRRFATVAGVIVPSINSAQTAAVQWVEDAAERFLADVQVGLTEQRCYELKTSTNHWLLFPRALYNRTIGRGNSHTPPIVVNSTSEDAFWNFLQVTPSEVELSLWTTNIRKRLAFSLHVYTRSFISLLRQ